MQGRPQRPTTPAGMSKPCRSKSIPVMVSADSAGFGLVREPAENGRLPDERLTAAPGRTAALADVTGTGGAHLGAAGEAEGGVGDGSLLQLQQFGGGVRLRCRLALDRGGDAHLLDGRLLGRGR